MRKIIVWAGLLLGLAAGGAEAADMNRGYYKAAPAYAPPPPYSWMGPYIGANIGYQWGEITANPTEPSGINGGLQLGYNWQSGHFVFGGETDLQISAADDTFAAWKFSNPWFGTARLRAGYAMNNVLLYVTGGLAYGRIKGELLGVPENRTSYGYAIGGGMEVGLTQNWSAKVEYLYLDLADRGFVITGTNNGLETSLLRFGVNYRF